MTIRTFIALEIPIEALSKVLNFRDTLLSDIKNIRWEPKEKLHLTLKFLGDTDSGLTENYFNTLEKIVAYKSSLKLSFSRFGVFRKGDEPKIFWIGLNENPYLINLVDEVESAFTDFGFEREKRKFKSHITLLRFRGYEDLEKILSLTQVKLPEINFTADKITFFESKLLSSGSIYRSLKSFNLKN